MKRTYFVKSATESRPLLLTPEVLAHLNEPTGWHSFLRAADADRLSLRIDVYLV
jgi:hypothetical protein